LIGHYLLADGTVKKAIFSITCTTCRTRLAVRSEAAVGQILECPKCRSMVYIAPPPGWAPAAAPAAKPPAPGPPPLDRVAAEPSMLELDLTRRTMFGEIFRRHLFMTAILSLVTLSVCLLGWLGWWWLHVGESEPAATDRPAAAVKEPKNDRASSPALRSEGVSAPQTSSAATSKPAASSPPPATPPTTPATIVPPSSPAVARAAKADPPPSIANAAANPTKEEKQEKEEAKQEAKQPEIKKSPPPQVDVATRMADPLAGIDLSDIPLVPAVDLLATLSTLPITLDADAMRQLGVSPSDRISLRLDSTTIGQALQAVAAKRGLAATVDNGQVILTLPAEYRETLRTVPYTVSDLTGDDKKAVAEFAKLVQRFVAPESWREAGGHGTAEPKDGLLTVMQSRDVHWQVLVFCEKLRNARQKPLRSHDRPEQFTLTTRTRQARAMLARRVALNFHEPAPLGRILAFLAKATESDILIDHAALAAAETSDCVEASLTVEKQPFGTVLDGLLRPLGLAYRAIGPNAIQVTGVEAAAERLELEFYPIGSRLAKEDTPLPLGEGPGVRAAKLVERLKSEVAAPTWTDAGGSGDVYFDAPSQCLIVLQSQPVQAEIERLLAAKGK
jgi:hypothetical protein